MPMSRSVTSRAPATAYTSRAPDATRTTVIAGIFTADLDPCILLESGDDLLLETGDRLLLDA